MYDNQAAIVLVVELRFYSKSRHIKDQYHRVREEITAGEVEVGYIPSEAMHADPLTKGLGANDFMRNPNPQILVRRTNGKLLALTDDTWDLSGSISPLLFSGLKYLEYLDLSWNNFHQFKIPDQLGDLLGLKYLNLSNAGFSGAIPNRLSNLSSLHTLDLSCAFFVDVGHRFQLTDLRFLALNGANLSIASSAKCKDWAVPISLLSKLKVLSLSNCSISGPIPINHLLNIASLSSLYLGFNLFFSTIPPRLVNLTFLSDLDISNSHVRGSIQHLPQIHMLNAGGNHDLLQFCNTSGIVKQYGKYFFSSGTILANNNIEGPMPPYLTNLSNLEYIDLSFNSLTGVIPSSISHIGNLQALNLYQNSLEGQIP
ncbi:systemin receptor SR160 [Amborella trichopoda]|uniref:systemin receptor SR160 n=1 Tax=Amborella trichopoda TaxID=13333 RepID=UPI0009C1356A|nr:systemin receptor SR160 [Amborella trichopoda]|eukprot:XP_020517653.1 systemin receptor SR160 [Amborella trichopoda]